VAEYWVFPPMPKFMLPRAAASAEVIEPLGGIDYIRAVLAWRDDSLAWSRSRSRRRGPAPTPPPPLNRLVFTSNRLRRMRPIGITGASGTAFDVIG
jgi:hypothetical protein